ncbi:hypothetical protein JF544_07510 [Halobacillus kuroshimensis]|uniref:Uncharacterized protein n=1 Tax=Halobacillus kuroshimensis TaxID=302481 RepID=A0ABS3DUR6_9BACI|nr:hypothetical protein [Halobacillus kuroshimensis]MBN8235093.1 hypothetical protein [Halobacillus kuroshimensis]
MFIPLLLALITVVSVVAAVKKKNPVLFAVPLAALCAAALIKVIMVPMPFWETVVFIFNLKG